MQFLNTTLLQYLLQNLMTRYCENDNTKQPAIKLNEYPLTGEANSHLATQEIPCLLWYSKVQYCVHKGLPPVPNLSHMNPIHTITLQVYHPKYCMHVSSFHTCYMSAHLILLDLKRTSYEAHHYTVFSSLLSLPPNIHLSTLFSNILKLRTHQFKRPSFTPTQKKQ
jgi:hypothetical protein